MIINRTTRFLIQLLFLATRTSAQLQVTDCASASPVPGVNCYNLRSELLGTTDGKGQLRIRTDSFPLFLQADGYEMLTVPDSSSLNNICLSHITERLVEVTISSKKMTVAEYLRSLYEEYKKHYINTDTTLYYRFIYKLDIPDSNWSETTQGYIAYRIGKNAGMSFKNILNEISIIRYDYKATNRKLTNSKMYKKIKVARPVQTLLFELMSEYMGTFAWKTITDQNSRKLALKQSGSDEVFSSYSLKDKSYVMEQLVFDEHHTLKSVDLYTPNLFDEDGTFLFKPYDFSARNTENSYYHTSYHYTATAPYMLQAVKSRNIILSRKTSYEVNFELELLDFIPERETDIDFSRLAKGPLKQ